MPIRIAGPREHNLRDLTLTLPDGFTIVTGVSGSGKSSLVFDTIYHEARRRFADVIGHVKEQAANVDSIVGLGPAVAIGQDLLNRNPGSTVATASGVHPLLRIAYAAFGVRRCVGCGADAAVSTVDEAASLCYRSAPVEVHASLQRDTAGSHRALLRLLSET